jgi:hypothetical protein
MRGLERLEGQERLDAIGFLPAVLPFLPFLPYRVDVYTSNPTARIKASALLRSTTPGRIR